MIRSITVLLLIAVASFAQTRREFEVTAIRQVSNQAPNQVTAGVTIDGSQVRITSLSLKDYASIGFALGINQIVGPDWLGLERFDVAAKLPDGASQGDVPEMIQTMLADRFGMKAHREKREFPVYALEVAKSGLTIKETVSPAEVTASGSDRPVTVAAGGSGAGVAINFGNGSFFSLGNTGFESKRLPMASFADMLTRFLDRPVVDMTGLKGGYDMVLELTPEERLPMLIRSAVAAGLILPPQALALLEGASNDSLTNSLKKAGLTLEGRRAPLEVLVIDQIQKTPTEN